MRYANTQVMISKIVKYMLYAFHLWDRHRYTKKMATNPSKFQASNITSYAMAYYVIQEHNDHDEDPVINIPSLFNKSNKSPHFKK